MNSAPAAIPSTVSVARSRRAEESVSSCRISVNSIATADTSVKAQRWWRKANSVDMARAPVSWAICRRQICRIGQVGLPIENLAAVPFLKHRSSLHGTPNLPHQGRQNTACDYQQFDRESSECRAKSNPPEWKAQHRKQCGRCVRYHQQMDVSNSAATSNRTPDGSAYSHSSDR